MTAQLQVIDRRFVRLRALPESVALDYANDISALAAEAHSHLTAQRVLKVSDALFEIHGTARKWAGEVEEAPVISADQLDFALCGDGVGQPGHGSAA